MKDDLDRLLRAQGHTPPADFAERLTALARNLPQAGQPQPRSGFWQWASLAGAAGLGVMLLGEFAFFAFAAVGAQ